jgi:Zn-dependent protease
MKTILSAANVVITIAGPVGAAGYFLPSIFGGLRDQILQWAIFLAVFALLVGIANLVGVHQENRHRQRGAFSALFCCSPCCSRW